MACSSCRKRAEKRRRELRPQTEANAVDFTLKVPLRTTIMSSDQKMRSITTPLVKNRPKGGTWGVDVRIKDKALRVHRATATATFTEVRRLYALNNIEITDETIWFNLNLIWVQGLSARHIWVTHSDLLSLLK